MKDFLSKAMVVVGVILVACSWSAAGPRPSKCTQVCHRGKTIEVPNRQAANAHRAHGDYCGRCIDTVDPYPIPCPPFCPTK